MTPIRIIVSSRQVRVVTAFAHAAQPDTTDPLPSSCAAREHQPLRLPARWALYCSIPHPLVGVVHVGSFAASSQSVKSTKVLDSDFPELDKDLPFDPVETSAQRMQGYMQALERRLVTAHACDVKPFLVGNRRDPVCPPDALWVSSSRPDLPGCDS